MKRRSYLAALTSSTLFAGCGSRSDGDGPTATVPTEVSGPPTGWNDDCSDATWHQRLGGAQQRGHHPCQDGKRSRVTQITQFRGEPSPSVHDGERVYVTDYQLGGTHTPAPREQYVVALPLRDGVPGWQTKVSEPCPYTPIYHEGELFVMGKEGTVFVFETATGELTGKLQLDIGLPNELVTFGDTIVSSSTESLFAISMPDRELRWKRQEYSQIQSHVAIADRTVFCSTMDETVLAVSVDDGSLRWRASLPSVSTAPMVHDGTVYVSGPEHLYVVIDGEVRWDEPTAEGFAHSPLWAEFGVVTTHAETVTCRDGTTGVVEWSTTLDSRVIPNGLTTEESVVLPTEAWSLVELRGDDGTVRSTLELPNEGYLTPPMPVRGEVVFGTGLGALYRTVAPTEY